MKFKKLTSGVAVLGVAAGMTVAGATGASATVNTIHPYLDFNFGLVPGSVIDTATIGSTNPGNPASKLCIVFALDGAGAPTNGVANGGNAEAYNGKVNGSVVNAGTVIDMKYVDQTLLATVPTCVQTVISLDDAGTVAAGTTGAGVKAKGTITTVTASAVQPGILATSISYLKVTHSVGVTVATPAGATIIGTPTSTETLFQMPAATTANKSVLDTGACADTDQVVVLDDLDTALPKPSNTPFTAAMSTYTGASNQNVATFHECAQSSTSSPGKAAKTKFAFTGAGTASVSFVYAATLNPRTWDTTIGKCKETDDAARVLTCKGNYGKPVPFALAVRQGASASIDPFGLLHKQDTTLTGASVTMS